MKVPKPSQNDVSAKLWDEVKAGFATEGATETQRLDDLRSVTELDKAGPNREVPGLGKLVANVPLLDFIRLQHKYGREEIMSKDFIRYMHKKVPETKVANV